MAALHSLSKTTVQKTRCKVFSKDRIDDEASGCRALEADPVAERESLRTLLARPFYWLGFVAVMFLFIFLWSAERVEGASATDLE